ncbi:MAG: integration host factor subunit beta [Gammaproteobacteria bacterium]|nr:integration host factor subunit beta [Gammaproteobacteria bacterium]
MTKSELKKKLLEQFSGFSEKDIDDVVELIIEEIRQGIFDKDGMEVRGFGSLFVQKYGGRTVRNPRTGEQIFKSSSHRLHFRAGKILNRRINATEDTSD